MRQIISMTPAVIEEHVQKESGHQHREQRRIAPFLRDRIQSKVESTEFSLIRNQPK